MKKIQVIIIITVIKMKYRGNEFALRPRSSRGNNEHGFQKKKKIGVNK